MNSSQDRNFAIVFRTYRSGLSERKSLPLTCAFVLALTLQGCSLIEGVFDGSAFSDSSTPAATEAKTEDKGELDGETVQTKPAAIKDLKASSTASLKPLAQRPKATPTDENQVAVTAPKSIEIMWQVPTEPVEAYHIYLMSGALDPTDEKKHFRVLVSSLKKEDDPTYGPIYKYQIPGNIKANTIQIKAENRYGLSEPSEPMIVQGK